MEAGHWMEQPNQTKVLKGSIDNVGKYGLRGWTPQIAFKLT